MSLYGEIFERAQSTFHVEPTDPEFLDKWVGHWFSTAATFKKEAEDEGLPETAKAIQVIIDEQCRM